jgi:hypothetical protein
MRRMGVTIAVEDDDPTTVVQHQWELGYLSSKHFGFIFAYVYTRKVLYDLGQNERVSCKRTKVIA